MLTYPAEISYSLLVPHLFEHTWDSLQELCYHTLPQLCTFCFSIFLSYAIRSNLMQPYTKRKPIQLEQTYMWACWFMTNFAAPNLRQTMAGTKSRTRSLGHVGHGTSKMWQAASVTLIENMWDVLCNQPTIHWPHRASHHGRKKTMLRCGYHRLQTEPKQTNLWFDVLEDGGILCSSEFKSRALTLMLVFFEFISGLLAMCI